MDKQTTSRPLPRSKSAVLSTKKTTLNPQENSLTSVTLTHDQSVRKPQVRHSLSSFGAIEPPVETGSSRYFLRRRSTACIQTENVQGKRQSMSNLNRNNLDKNTQNLPENVMLLSLPKREISRLKSDHTNYSLYPNLAIHAEDFIKLAILTPSENLKFSRRHIKATFKRSIPRDEFIRRFKEDQELERAL